MIAPDYVEKGLQPPSSANPYKPISSFWFPCYLARNAKERISEWLGLWLAQQKYIKTSIGILFVYLFGLGLILPGCLSPPMAFFAIATLTINQHDVARFSFFGA